MSKFTFTADQAAMLDSFIQFLGSDEKYMVVQGSSGCGKSTMIPYMIERAEAFYKMRSVVANDDFQMYMHPQLTATTNPAVAVLSKLAGRQARTIHSFLGLKPRKNMATGQMSFVPGRDSAIRNHELIFVDESSMVDNGIKTNMDDLIDDTCKVVLIGDWYQLTAVGETEVLTRTMNCRVALMNEIMRNSGIIAHVGQQFRQTVDTGVFLPIPTGHPQLVTVDGPTFQDRVDDAFRGTDYDPSKAKILTYTNGFVNSYNDHVRQIKGQPKQIQVGEIVTTNKPIITTGYSTTVDSLVTVTGAGSVMEDPDYGVTGRMLEIDNSVSLFMPNEIKDAVRVASMLSKAAKTADPKDRQAKWQEFYHVKENWLDLRMPYASTVHKAQGSSHDEVFINLADIGRCYTASAVARMLYVAISRARYRVTLFGELPPKYAG